MADDLERPTVGLVPKLLVGALALFGLLMLISWVTSWLFGLLRYLRRWRRLRSVSRWGLRARMQPSQLQTWP